MFSGKNVLWVNSQKEFEEAQKSFNLMNDFLFDELKCRISKNLPVYQENLYFLFLASRFKKSIPFQVTSFYRSEKHPLYTKNSQHSFAAAFDCVPLTMNYKDFSNLLFGCLDKGKQAFPAIGIYSNHVHFDSVLRDNAPLYWTAQQIKNDWKYEYFPEFYEMLHHYDELKIGGAI